mmetsp:Transcript_30270/g.46962  ORF Transcript_30270/g.46962 Transcript_30270/m.46962 type:complete len:87 (-) Transcript_30270:68-328(-)
MTRQSAPNKDGTPLKKRAPSLPCHDFPSSLEPPSSNNHLTRDNRPLTALQINAKLRGDCFWCEAAYVTAAFDFRVLRREDKLFFFT